LRPTENALQSRPSSDDRLFLIGPYPEDLCLGFVNTLSWRGRSDPVETLYSAADLFNWIEHSEILPRVSIAEAHNWARDHEKRAAQGFAKAILVREALFAIFSAIAAGAGVAREDFQILEAALARGPHRTRLVPTANGYAWSGPVRRITIYEVLAPMLWSAGDLLVRAEDRRIRCCANDACLWLFIDQSKTNSRRWCDMQSCGNRAKAQRHYAKSKQSPGHASRRSSGNEG
jgi:predicted RNA-binding Zn ribbon-like protein